MCSPEFSIMYLRMIQTKNWIDGFLKFKLILKKKAYTLLKFTKYSLVLYMFNCCHFTIVKFKHLKKHASNASVSPKDTADFENATD